MSEETLTTSLPGQRGAIVGEDAPAPRQQPSPPEQHGILRFLEGIAGLALPMLLGLYILISIALQRFYGVFGLTFDQAGINQMVLLSRMANAIIYIVIYGVPLACVVVTGGWLLGRLTGRRLGPPLRSMWRRPSGPALVVMLLVGWWYLSMGELKELAWVIGTLVGLVVLVTLAAAAGRLTDRMTGGRAGRLVCALRRGESKPWLVVTLLVGMAYSVLGGLAWAMDSTVIMGGFGILALAVAVGATVGPLLVLVFFVFLVPFRLLRHTRYYRLVTTSIVAVLTVLVLSQYAFNAVSTAAVRLYEEGKFTLGLQRYLGIQPQIATIRWSNTDKLLPEERKVLVLGQSEEALWLYDCVQKRTIRVSGGAVVATQLELTPDATLTCEEPEPKLP